MWFACSSFGGVFLFVWGFKIFVVVIFLLHNLNQHSNASKTQLPGWCISLCNLLITP